MSDTRPASIAPRRSARLKRAREEEEKKARETSSGATARTSSSISHMATRPAKQHKTKGSALSLSPAQQCCTDQLHVIFAFVDLKQLMPIVRSCRAWLAAAERMPLRSLQLKLKRWKLHSLSISRFRRHLSDVEAIGEWQTDDVARLHSLPSLDRLKLHIDSASVESLLLAPFTHAAPVHPPFRFPQQLTTLELLLSSDGSQLAQQAQLNAIAFCPSLTSLRLERKEAEEGEEQPQVHLSFLDRLQHLTSLFLRGISLQSDNLAAIGSLPLTQLTAIEANGWETHTWTDELWELLQQTSRLRLKELDLSCTTVGKTAMQALLPLADTLESIDPWLFKSTCFYLLPQFRALRYLSVDLHDRQSAEEPPAFLSTFLQHLPICAPLTSLRLSGVELIGSQLQQLLQSLPQLESLTLYSCRLVNPSQLQYGLALTTLRLDQCAIHPSALATLQQLPALTSLAIEFGPTLDEEALEQFTLPSPLFPNLTFLYVSRRWT